MYKVAVWLLILCGLNLMGCQSALLKMRHENEAYPEVLREKERQLKNVQLQNQRLLEEKRRLLSDLDQGNLSIDELSERIAHLQAQNAQIRARNDSAVRSKQRLSKKLQHYQYEIEQINALDEQGGVSNLQKRRLLDELKRQIRAEVEKEID